MLPLLVDLSTLEASAPVANLAAQSPLDNLLSQARSLRYAQRYFEAASLYRKYIAQAPSGGRLAEARFWLAATLEQDQRWDEAAHAYSEFLTQHAEERLLGREALLNRIRCWGIRQGQNPQADTGLLAALADAKPEVQVAAALQLAKRKDKRAVDGLQKGLSLPAYADACSTALVAMGLKPAPVSPSCARFLVIRITQKEKPSQNEVTIRIALVLARALENYLSNEQIQQARAKGVNLENISDQAAVLPKGSVLFSVEDKKSRIDVTVE